MTVNGKSVLVNAMSIGQQSACFIVVLLSLSIVSLKKSCNLLFAIVCDADTERNICVCF